MRSHHLDQTKLNVPFEKVSLTTSISRSQLIHPPLDGSISDDGDEIEHRIHHRSRYRPSILTRNESAGHTDTWKVCYRNITRSLLPHPDRRCYLVQSERFA